MHEKKSRVLITGIRGFTGQYMAREMARAGYDVYGLSHSPFEHDAKQWRHVDLTDQSALHALLAEIKPHFVIHLAAVSFVGHKDAHAFYQTNVMGTRNLLESLASLSLPIKGILLASSANIYGTAFDGMQDENTTPNPVNDYAISKLTMEYVAKMWMSRLPIIIARPFNYTGVGQSEAFLLPKIVSHFRRKAQMIELGNVDVYRDFSDVRAVVSAYRQLLEKKAFGETVNVCSGVAHSLHQIIHACERLAGYAIELCVNADFVRDNEVKTLFGNNAKLLTLIDHFDNPTLETTLRWMMT